MTPAVEQMELVVVISIIDNEERKNAIEIRSTHIIIFFHCVTRHCGRNIYGVSGCLNTSMVATCEGKTLRKCRDMLIKMAMSPNIT